METSQKIGFNLNIVECKFEYSSLTSAHCLSFNLNIVECKSDFYRC